MRRNEINGWLFDQAYTVTMDNGSKVTVQAVDERDARQKAEAEADRDGYGGLAAVDAVESGVE